jgi:hypothetical protein
MGTGTGPVMKFPVFSGVWPEPVPIFSQTLSTEY